MPDVHRLDVSTYSFVTGTVTGASCQCERFPRQFADIVDGYYRFNVWIYGPKPYVLTWQTACSPRPPEVNFKWHSLFYFYVR
jgi:hypothetical protein